MMQLCILREGKTNREEYETIGNKTCKIIYQKPANTIFGRIKGKRWVKKCVKGFCTANKETAAAWGLPLIENRGRLTPVLTEKLIRKASKKASFVLFVGEEYDAEFICRLAESLPQLEICAPRETLLPLSEFLLEKIGAALDMYTKPRPLGEKVGILLPGTRTLPKSGSVLDFRSGLPPDAILVPPKPLGKLLRKNELLDLEAYLTYFALPMEETEIYLSNFTIFSGK